MLYFNVLGPYQARTSIDLRQVFEAWVAADRELATRFAGSMRWQVSHGHEYLKRRIGARETSLGIRSEETEHAYARFTAGRAAAQNRKKALDASLRQQAAVARSVGLGRVPLLIAKMLRTLDAAHILGKIRIVGTNALFAYETLCGVHIARDALATGDIDLLLDARHRLRLEVDANDGPDPKTILGLLRRLDGSFVKLPGKPYRVANKDGFMVDLIRPHPRPPWRREPGAEPLAADDLSPSPIVGLQWLVNVPPVEAFVIDERGFPARIVAPDPRVWMAHKAWLSKQPMRQDEKKRRDLLQARIVMALLREHMPQYPIDDEFKKSLPKQLRAECDFLMSENSTDNFVDGDGKPEWW